MAGPRQGGTNQNYPGSTLKVEVSLERTSYVEDEVIPITVRACNQSGTEFTKNQPRGHEFAIMARNSSGDLVATGFGVTDKEAPPIVAHTWAGHECKTFARAWSQKAGIEPDIDRRPRIPAGTYRLSATLLNGDPAEDSPTLGPSGNTTIELAGVRVTATTDRASYEPGEPVVISWSACNANDSAHVQYSRYQPTARWAVASDRGAMVGGTREEGAQGSFQEAFGPRQCRAGSYTWDQMAWGRRVEPGTYRVTVRWSGTTRPDPESLEFLTPAPLVIELRP